MLCESVLPNPPIDPTRPPDTIDCVLELVNELAKPVVGSISSVIIAFSGIIICPSNWFCMSCCSRLAAAAVILGLEGLLSWQSSAIDEYSKDALLSAYLATFLKLGITARTLIALLKYCSTMLSLSNY